MKWRSTASLLFLCAVGSLLCPAQTIEISSDVDADFGIVDMVGLDDSEDFAGADSDFSGWARDEDFTIGSLSDGSQTSSSSDTGTGSIDPELIKEVKAQMLAASSSSASSSSSDSSSS
jgi:hypothetical protein